MSNQVYANNMEVSCKKAAGKSICAFPDVCMTPPQTPATPPGVPIPYPNTGMASDCTDGSSSVKISGQEVMLKNKSYYKKSMGDEAGCAPKKGVMTSKNMGKVYFAAWSTDVKVEGENVVRHLDLTTHNHGSSSNGAITVDTDEVASALQAAKAACADKKNKPKKTYVVYMAVDKSGRVYIGRTRGPVGMSVNAILNKRKSSHHRKGIGKLFPLCVTDSYAAVRGAEQKHYADFVKHGESVSNSPSKKDHQINPISPKKSNQPKKDRYMNCSKAVNPLCGVCSS
jgi:Domain of unknown function (DUF4150)